MSDLLSQLQSAPRKLTVLERFEAKYIPEPNSGCWLWDAAYGRDGYGRFWVAGKMECAHRWVYEHYIGLIPDGLQLDHLCRVPSCVNPYHLEPVTSQENTLRGVSPPAVNLDKTHCIRGHEFTVENTRIHSRGWRICRSCDRERWHDRASSKAEAA